MKYLTGYPPELIEQVKQLSDAGKVESYLQNKYPIQNLIRSDKQLYEFAIKLKRNHLRHAPNPNRVAFDSKTTASAQALGLNKSKQRIHGKKIKTKNEILISTAFKNMPALFLEFIVVHELAHLKEKQHDKSFYKLCTNMLPDYHQIEFDMRVYLQFVKN